MNWWNDKKFRFSNRWIVSIPRRSRGPNDQTRYYGLWSRCQYSNTSFVIPDISSQPNIENFVCRPNFYIRYDTTNEQLNQICYESRHQCSSIIGVHPDCKCKYLHSNQIQQWSTILASVFLLLTIIILYLKLIASPQTSSYLFIFYSNNKRNTHWYSSRCKTSSNICTCNTFDFSINIHDLNNDHCWCIFKT